MTSVWTASAAVEAGFGTCQISDETRAALLEEAQAAQFTRATGSAYAARREPRLLTSPFDLASAPTGAVVRDLAANPATSGLVADTVRADISLHASTYILYDKGSYIGVHTDRLGCDVNLFVLLAGAPTSFEFHPPLADRSVDALFEAAKQSDGFIDGAQQVELPVDGSGVVFVGSVVPHQRRPVDSALLFLSLCYSWTG